MALETLSHYVETIPQQEALNGEGRLCQNLDCDNFIIYTTHNLRRYSPNVCPLQIYAAFVEIAADRLEMEECPNGDPRLTSIARIAISTMNFLRECLKRPAWVDSQSPNENNGGRGTPTGSGCHCYLYMICSAIAQIYVVINFWFNNMNNKMNYLGEFEWVSFNHFEAHRSGPLIPILLL